MDSELSIYKRKYEEVLFGSFSFLDSEISRLLRMPSKNTDALVADVIDESRLWKRAVLPACSFSVIKDLIWEKGLKREVTKGDNFETWRAYLYSGEELASFQESSNLSRFVFEEKVKDETSFIFAGSYGYAKKAFLEVDFQEFKPLFDRKGWSPLFVDNSANTGILKCRYKNLTTHLVFVEKEEVVLHQREKKHFYLCVLPDSNSDNWVELSNGVKLRGTKGYVPGINIIQRFAKLPWFHYRVEKVKGKVQLNHFTFSFRRFQVVNGKVQWIVRPLKQRSQ